MRQSLSLGPASAQSALMVNRCNEICLPRSSKSAQSALMENSGQEVYNRKLTHLHYDEDHAAKVDRRLQGGHSLCCVVFTGSHGRSRVVIEGGHHGHRVWSW